MNSEIAQSAGQSTDDGKVIPGKDGWLFLGNDRNQVLKQHSGEVRFSPDDLLRWQLVLEDRIARLRKLDIPYFFVVAPNQHSIFPEKLPDHVERGQKRPVHQLIDHLAGSGSDARVFYPLQELLDAKNAGQIVYLKTETHWSELGAFVAYRALIHQLKPVVQIREVPPEDVSLRKMMVPGDLGAKVTPPQLSLDVFTDLREHRASQVSDNLVVNTGRIVVFECNKAPPTKCVMFGDSFAYNLLLFLCESFRSLVFAHTATVDDEIVREERPDVVISLMTERFLIQVPSDSTEPSVHERARSKIAEGRLFAPKLTLRVHTA